MEVNIRPATLRDAAEMARLSGHFGYACEESEMHERLERLLDSEFDWAWVAEGADGLLGWMQLTEMQRLESGRFIEITGLVVDEAHRSLGVGGMLLQQARLHAELAEMKRVVVRSNVVRERAIGFYLKHGYVAVKRQQVLQLNLE
ncbi:MAG: GNAT family N-acetyltransferase [Bacteroidia bacterium]